MKQQLLSAALCAAVSLAAAPGAVQARENAGPAASAGAPAGLAQGRVTIRRDEYGMPHVYAGTVYGLFYGYGYAVAQDRLFQMEMARRSTQGRVAECWAPRWWPSTSPFGAISRPSASGASSPRWRRPTGRSWTATPPA